MLTFSKCTLAITPTVVSISSRRLDKSLATSSAISGRERQSLGSGGGGGGGGGGGSGGGGGGGAEGLTSECIVADVNVDDAGVVVVGASAAGVAASGRCTASAVARLLGADVVAYMRGSAGFFLFFGIRECGE